MKKNSLFMRFRRKLKSFKDGSIGSLLLCFKPDCKKSFSQCGEDIIVKYIFDTLGILYPTYLDIGAHKPFKHSNTALFYLLGSRGINIEPDPDLFSEFPVNRPKDVNLNFGIAAKDDNLDFFVMKNRTLNTFSRRKAEEYQEKHQVPISEIKKIPVTTLNEIVFKFGKKTFWDFLSLDVEGLELNILKTLDWNACSPKVICCETISYSTSGKGIKDNELINYVCDQGYLIYADTNVNTIFVKRDIWES